MGTYLVMKNNFIRCFHHKRLFFITFLLPVILCFLLGIVNFDKVSVRVGILTDNNTDVKVIKEVAGLLNSSKGIQYGTAEEYSLNTELMTGEYHVILDYRRSTQADQFQLISYQKEEKSKQMQKLLKQAFLRNEPIRLSEMEKDGLSVTERTMAMLMSIFLIFSTVYTSRIIRDRETGVLQRYRFAQNKSSGYILGYLIHGLLVVFVQAIICMLILLTVLKNFNPSLLQGFIMAVVIAVISAFFGVLICLGSKSEVQADIMASSLAAVLSLLGGTFVAVTAMPGLLRFLSIASPVRWAVELLRVIP